MIAHNDTIAAIFNGLLSVCRGEYALQILIFKVGVPIERREKESNSQLRELDAKASYE